MHETLSSSASENRKHTGLLPGELLLGALNGTNRPHVRGGERMKICQRTNLSLVQGKNRLPKRRKICLVTATTRELTSHLSKAVTFNVILSFRSVMSHQVHTMIKTLL